MIHIVCLKWGEKFNPIYVNNLFKAIKKNCNHEFKFHCFTDNSTMINNDVIIHHLPSNNLQGWWNKLYLFSNQIDIPIGEKILFVDLDTIVVDNIDSLLSHTPATIVGLRSFYKPKQFASGLMMWRHGDHEHVWLNFIQNSENHVKRIGLGGDQVWIGENVKEPEYWQDLFPGKVASYKAHCSNGLPEEVAIVCYHGTPSIIQSYTETVSNRDGVWHPQEWVKQYWNEHEN